MQAEDDHEPAHDLVFDRGIAPPYDPYNLVRGIREGYRRRLLQLADTGEDPALARMTPEQRLLAEKNSAALQAEAALVRKDEDLRLRIAAANWRIGPQAIAPAADIALQLPEGAKYLASEDLQQALGPDAPPAPPGSLVSLIADSRERWRATLLIMDSGPIDISGLPALSDPFETLARLRRGAVARRTDSGLFGALRIDPLADVQPSLMRWVIAPTYDVARHRLEWAHTNGGRAGAQRVDFYQALLGKRQLALLAVTSMDAYYSVDEILAYRPAIRQVMDGLAFAPGHVYADVPKDDGRKRMGIEELVFGAAAPEHGSRDRVAGIVAAENEAREEEARKVFWKGVGVVAACIPLIAIARRRRRRAG